MSLWIPVSVAAGGAIGSLARFWIGRLTADWTSNFPLGTLLVNLLGSIAIGFWAAFLLRNAAVGDSTQPTSISVWDHAIRVGFLGGLTTFSSFSLETTKLLIDRHYLLAGANCISHVMIALAAAWFGLKIGNAIWQ
jgi:fluoride exporter